MREAFIGLIIDNEMKEAFFRGLVEEDITASQKIRQWIKMYIKGELK